MHTDLTLRGVCPNTAAAFKAREAADVAEEEAKAEHVSALARVEEARALVADPVRVAREGLEPGEVQRALRKAEEVAYSAEVKAHTRTQELEAARAELRRCAEGAAETVRERAAKRVAAINGRIDAARGEIVAAEAEKAEVVETVMRTLLEVFGYERSGVAVELAA